MARSRCLHHNPRARTFPSYVEPVGYPDSALICGITDCNEQGLIYLDHNDIASLTANPAQVIFGGFSSLAKMKRKLGAPILPNVQVFKVKSK